jgi:hypothetical protein
MKVKVEFDVSETDPIKALKEMTYHFTDGEVIALIEDILDGRAWGAKVEIFEHENPVDHWEMNLDEEPDDMFLGQQELEDDDMFLEQQELEDYEGLSGFSNPDIERL